MSHNLTFNGINGVTGDYLLPELSVEDISKIAQGEEFDKDHLNELKERYRSEGNTHLGVTEGVDPKELSQAGWGVIFAHDDGDKVDAWKEALQPLLNLRREQAGDLYKEYVGQDAYRPRESKTKFLARHRMGPGPANPEVVPYYLLIVASPESIPYRFQYQLDVQYAVGRIYFETLEEYTNYANSVVRAEHGDFKRSPKATFFGVCNRADQATKLSASELVQPLADWVMEDKPNWAVEAQIKEEATKANLSQLLHNTDGPALLFTASHGLGFPKDDPRQLSHQGALLCQDWPGSLQWGRKPIPEEHYFSGDDISSDANLGGMINFHFACYGAGTPQKDDFAHKAFQERLDIASHAFIARLPQRLLGHPKGGTLAVIGHVERAWGYSFLWGQAGAQLEVFKSTLKRLTEGHPVGSAVEFFNQRYSELSTTLTDELEEIKYGMEPNDQELAGMWIANNDARSYVVIGDPAVRLNIL